MLNLALNSNAAYRQRGSIQDQSRTDRQSIHKKHRIQRHEDRLGEIAGEPGNKLQLQIEMADKCINHVCGNAGILRKSEEKHCSILESVQSFRIRFGQTTGIAGYFEAAGPVRVNERLADEFFKKLSLQEFGVDGE